MNNIHVSEPLISIVMPAYNAERYLKEAMDSVLKQTYSNWELILIDDGSSDNTVEVATKVAANDSRIKFYINPENLGVSNTRNKGISLANGEWIAFLDSDDIWKEKKLEKQLNFSKEKKSDFTYSGVCYISENGTPYKGLFEVPLITSYQELLKQNVITCSSVLIKKNLLETVEMERDDMHEDYAVWLRILKTGINAHGLNEPLLIYRISSTSKSGKKINSFKMTYKVFRFIELNSANALFYTSSHLLKSYIKYRKIKNVK
jgi:teichuronic acid biosynthesis glycosyltransferase TuaG